MFSFRTSRHCHLIHLTSCARKGAREAVYGRGRWMRGSTVCVAGLRTVIHRAAAAAAAAAAASSVLAATFLSRRPFRTRLRLFIGCAVRGRAELRGLERKGGEGKKTLQRVRKKVFASAADAQKFRSFSRCLPEQIAAGRGRGKPRRRSGQCFNPQAFARRWIFRPKLSFRPERRRRRRGKRRGEISGPGLSLHTFFSPLLSSLLFTSPGWGSVCQPVGELRGKNNSRSGVWAPVSARGRAFLFLCSMEVTNFSSRRRPLPWSVGASV